MVALPFNFAILEWAAGTSKVISDAVLQFKNYQVLMEYQDRFYSDCSYDNISNKYTR